METSNVRQPQARCYRYSLSWGFVSATERAESRLGLPQSRTVATSITRMVIFIRAVQSLKTDYVTSGANLRMYARSGKAILC